MAKEGKASRKFQRRKFKGIWVPALLWINPNLRASEKVILAEVDSLDTEEYGCFASNSHFAKILGNTPRNASATINKMIEKGLLSSTVDPSDANRRYLKVLSSKTTIVIPPVLSSKPSTDYSRNHPDPMDENDVTLIESTIESSIEREPPLPDFLNDQKQKGKIYLSAKAGYLLSSLGFNHWFEKEVLLRFPKFNDSTVNQTTLRDWDKTVFEKYGEDIATAAVLKLIDTNPKLKGNVPGPAEVKRLAAQIKHTIDTQRRTEKRCDSWSGEQVGVWDKDIKLADEDPAAFLEKYKPGSFLRSFVDKNPDLKAAYEKASKSIQAKEGVA